jgi:hypothetical protein
VIPDQRYVTGSVAEKRTANSGYLEARGGIELEPFWRRERSGSLQAKSRARSVAVARRPSRRTSEQVNGYTEILEARGGIEPPIEVLQTSALPLGDRAPSTPRSAKSALRRGPEYLKNRESQAINPRRSEG